MTAAEVEQLKRAPATKGVMPEILHRWSPVPFPTALSAPATLRPSSKPPRWAASSRNEQPWRFLVGARGSDTSQKILSILMPFNQAWARSAAVPPRRRQDEVLPRQFAQRRCPL